MKEDAEQNKQELTPEQSEKADVMIKSIMDSINDLMKQCNELDHEFGVSYQTLLIATCCSLANIGILTHKPQVVLENLAEVQIKTLLALALDKKPQEETSSDTPLDNNAIVVPGSTLKS
jgi:hypothetical protein